MKRRGEGERKEEAEKLVTTQEKSPRSSGWAEAAEGLKKIEGEKSGCYSSARVPGILMDKGEDAL